MSSDRPWEIVFEDVRVPVSQLLGVPGQGWKLARNTLDVGRLIHGPKAIGRDIAEGTVTPTGGYDNAWIFDDWDEAAPPAVRAVAYSPLSRIEMTVTTDQPSIQFYSGNFLDGTLAHKADQGPGVYSRWDALALEAQRYPDTVHHAGDARWPTVEVQAGGTYRQHTAYRFARR